MRERSMPPRAPIQPAVAANGACWRRQAATVVAIPHLCDQPSPTQDHAFAVAGVPDDSANHRGAGRIQTPHQINET